MRGKNRGVGLTSHIYFNVYAAIRTMKDGNTRIRFRIFIIYIRVYPVFIVLSGRHKGVILRAYFLYRSFFTHCHPPFS